jgi:acetolactate synthase-1/2/3 large subunit
MNGAQSLVHTLCDGGLTTCFMNPGTSEMHFVAALDSAPEMRAALCLFEGVATGCADGYARMTGKPAATLLHLGPGLGNGLANIHNARKAHSPMVNIIGDHATYHVKYDAPLTSDIEGIARPISDWVRTSTNAQSLAADGAEAIAIALTPPGQVATLIVPANTAWDPADSPALPRAPTERPAIPTDRIEKAIKVLNSGEETVILIGDYVMGSETLICLADRIAAGTGSRLIGNRAGARVSRGAGRPIIDRLPYHVDPAVEKLKGTKHIILVGAKQPVGFFAYPGKPSTLAPPDAQIHVLAEAHEDISAVLYILLEELDAPAEPPNIARLKRPSLPSGPLTPDSIWKTLSALMPENSIVSDEAITASLAAGPNTETAPPHDWLNVTGGAIGQGLPVATGAAVACPERQVFAMEADGSGMYTLQALWTQARESLNVVTVIFANQAYKILQGEMKNVGGEESGPKAAAMMRLDEPTLDWVSLAAGMGVSGTRTDSTETFIAAMRRGIKEPGPFLIEAII